MRGKDSMTIFFFALCAIGIAALYKLLYFRGNKALGDVNKVRGAIVTATKKAHFHQMLGMIILVAHASEISRVMSHISFMHFIVALFLFTLWFATRTESEAEFA